MTVTDTSSFEAWFRSCQSLTCWIVRVLGIAPLAIQSNAELAILCWLVLLAVQLNGLCMGQNDVVATFVLATQPKLHLHTQNSAPATVAALGEL